MKDAYYFSHDGNARNDEKLLAVRMKYGWEGYGLFWAIIEKLRESSNYILSKDYSLIAFDLRTDATKVKSLIEDFGLFLFTEDDKCFYSERLKNSMDYKESKSIKARESISKRWDKYKPDTDVIRTYNDGNTIKGKESKVNEKKESIESDNLEKEATEFLTTLPENIKNLAKKTGMNKLIIYQTLKSDKETCELSSMFIKAFYLDETYRENVRRSYMLKESLLNEYIIKFGNYIQSTEKYLNMWDEKSIKNYFVNWMKTSVEYPTKPQSNGKS